MARLHIAKLDELLLLLATPCVKIVYQCSNVFVVTMTTEDNRAVAAPLNKVALPVTSSKEEGKLMQLK